MMKFVIGIMLLFAFIYSIANTKNIVALNEQEALSSIINAECSNCSETEMYLVGSVVMNRLCGPDWPKNLIAVINQDKQFQGRNSKQYLTTHVTDKIANDLLNSLYITPDITYFCLKDSKRPMDIVVIEGQYHYFGK
jgi:hypothetical protein